MGKVWEQVGWDGKVLECSEWDGKLQTFGMGTVFIGMGNFSSHPKRFFRPYNSDRVSEIGVLPFSSTAPEFSKM